ncbi:MULTISPECIES: fumarylacetoacetate hydrolase family protein [Streptomyces]|uniref:fumarylacetoacetate hydrolase family protein n=1 Tax=Streptomyces TaxID=1883 RepID=UPI000A3B033C|nr:MULTISPECIES: fumarylacetoacetate hydrolase family protein [Streptomyces]MDX3585035.1 fumarylacetoacetate hydrolase family protein [Streptomyces europaeiscabiei]MDX3612086.1 fumarylacetoacetate hydrolase family protein [Streptomyces europaeiscabiei]MDX3635117.1 fumarylacetoacetate hydrolase family protein [Streptomyces europaeiscabiei]MDX3650101.1 fumarylacetoacetate hydrolase family protein [Streptomyces europaeiscabiei]WUD37680.1 fumarylacetoacetate hydrolase family protein [Streptomyces 
MKPVAPFAPFAGPFALGTLSTPDQAPFPGLVVPERHVLDLRTALEEPALTTRGILERWDEELPRLRALAADATGDAWQPLDALRVHAPVEPRQIFQSGANYRQHVIDLEVAHRSPDDPRTVEEARAEIAAVMDRRAAEDLPYVFIGLPSAITGPYDDVFLPSWAEQPDWELELAAVISRPAYRVSVEEAMDHVAGYTIANDLTDRATVFRRDMKAIGTDWLRSKNAPGFTPLGPWIVPTASVEDPGDLRVTLKLNGETMQDESTKDMLFGVARIVSYASQTARLLPGDLVLTGSPAGNGMHWGRLLRAGDVMDGSITGLGAQRTRCVAEEAA